ncbi:hypothetical protein JTE90_000679 [Oedothorax gibbosus]|uniref:Uncharacterized protein n=1 Tax=Oedothorax gibbosus TaxID=931172 RepID=A0AAV6TN50_9ARAC|nr:hypothetical protein JTE90_000679 [Oedothorax gibbosus]
MYIWLGTRAYPLRVGYEAIAWHQFCVAERAFNQRLSRNRGAYSSMHSGSSRGGACSKKMMLSSKPAFNQVLLHSSQFCHELQEEFLYEGDQRIVLDTVILLLFFTGGRFQDARLPVGLIWCPYAGYCFSTSLPTLARKEEKSRFTGNFRGSGIHKSPVDNVPVNPFISDSGPFA